MLPKKHRFSFKNSLPKQTLNSQSFSVRYSKNDEGLRVAVVISKRIDKRATVRNKIKRSMLNSIKKFVKTSDPLDLIFYVKQNVLNAEDLEKEIEKTISTVKQ